jgi:hypothetical protein
LYIDFNAQDFVTYNEPENIYINHHGLEAAFKGVRISNAKKKHSELGKYFFEILYQYWTQKKHVSGPHEQFCCKKWINMFIG